MEKILNEALSLKGRIAIKNYVAETADDKISWQDFNDLGYNTIDMSEDDFIEGIHIFKKGLPIEKSNVEIKPTEEKPVAEPVKEEPVAEEKPAENYEVKPSANPTIDNEDPETPEESVSTPTDSEIEAEAEADLAKEEDIIDLGNDVNEGIYKIAKTQWPNMYETLMRCKKKMGAEFDFRIIGEEVVEQRQLYTSNPFETGPRPMPFWADPIHIPVYVIKIVSKIKENNWEVVGLVQKVPTQDGITITPINNDYKIPSEYLRYTKIECDHCNTSRDRTFGAVVYNTATKEFRMVGKSCLKEYTGIDPTGLLALSHVYSVARHWDPMWGTGKIKYYDVSDILLIATAAIRLFGYVKPTYEGTTRWGGSIYSESEDCTRALVKEVYLNQYGVKKDISNNAKKVSKYIDEHMDELVKYASSAKEYMKTIDTQNDDFKRNVQVALSGNLVIEKQIGLVCSFPQIYARFVAEEENNKALGGFKPNNEYYPEEIGKVVSITNILKIVKGGQTRTGSYIISIFTTDGYELTAFANESDFPASWDDVGKVVGKIYRFNEFRGKKSTTLNNVKFFTNEDLYFQDDNAAPEAPLGKEKDKITIVPVSVEAGVEKSASYSYNSMTYYATLTITDATGHKFRWNCYNEDIYTNPQSLIGKKVTGTIKFINKDIEGNIESYTIGGRVKVEESRRDDLRSISQTLIYENKLEEADAVIRESNKSNNQRLIECHFAEMPGYKEKQRLNREFDAAINKVLEDNSKSEEELIDKYQAEQAYQDQLDYEACLDMYNYDEDGFCDGFTR